MDTKELVKKYWNDRPCNIKHSKKEFGSIEYFNEVEQNILFYFIFLNLLNLKNGKEKKFLR